MTEKKMVYVNEYTGDDKNSGLSEDKPVKTIERGLEIRHKERTDDLRIIGNAEKMIADYYTQKVK